MESPSPNSRLKTSKRSLQAAIRSSVQVARRMLYRPSRAATDLSQRGGSTGRIGGSAGPDGSTALGRFARRVTLGREGLILRREGPMLRKKSLAITGTAAGPRVGLRARNLFSIGLALCGRGPLPVRTPVRKRNRPGPKGKARNGNLGKLKRNLPNPNLRGFWPALKNFDRGGNVITRVMMSEVWRRSGECPNNRLQMYGEYKVNPYRPAHLPPKVNQQVHRWSQSIRLFGSIHLLCDCPMVTTGIRIHREVRPHSSVVPSHPHADDSANFLR